MNKRNVQPVRRTLVLTSVKWIELKKKKIDENQKKEEEKEERTLGEEKKESKFLI